MTFLSMLTLSLALAMDAFAVCLGAGCTLPRITPGHFVRMGGAFGLFQFAMPMIGCLLGRHVRHWIEAWDHWAAFALLAYVAVSMLREALDRSPDKPETTDPSHGLRLLVLAVATSLDALAIGLSFAVLDTPPLPPSCLIGAVCAVVSAAGLAIGSRLARAEILGRRAELLGAAVLLAIGLDILVKHGAFL